MASPILASAFHSASTVRMAAARSFDFSLANIISIGFRSGLNRPGFVGNCNQAKVVDR